MKIGLTYNLKKQGAQGGTPSGFCAGSGGLDAIEAVRDALLERHASVEMIEADEDAYEKLRASRPTMVLNMAEGLRGQSRESQMPAIMEMLRIPYTGSSPLALSLCLNKARAKEMLAHYGIPTARFLVAQRGDAGIERFLAFPMVVKPLCEGSGRGVGDDSIVRGPEELRRRVDRVVGEYGQPALVEEYLEGREFTVALLGNGESTRTLPIVEINYSALPEGVNPIYSNETRSVLHGPGAPPDGFTCPAGVNDRLGSAIETVAKDAFRALEVRDWCRIDVRLDAAGVPHVIELDPLPGIPMAPNADSCFSMAARAAGMSRGDLVNGVVDIALERYGISPSDRPN
ncbi:MAG: D-alanine--D-alanine ligase [Thermodesulfobacteriota bacterium]